MIRSLATVIASTMMADLKNERKVRCHNEAVEKAHSTAECAG
jgi:hypothetical protein